MRQDDAIVEGQQGEEEFRLYRHVRKCSLVSKAEDYRAMRLAG
jgi:hypothetical protein